MRGSRGSEKGPRAIEYCHNNTSTTYRGIKNPLQVYFDLLNVGGGHVGDFCGRRFYKILGLGY